MRDPFETLKVDRATITLTALKKRWWKLAGESHPDSGGDGAAFREYKLAYLEARDMLQRDPCPVCGGKGSISTTSGFHTVTEMCAPCGGSGYKHFCENKA